MSLYAGYFAEGFDLDPMGMNWQDEYNKEFIVTDEWHSDTEFYNKKYFSKKVGKMIVVYEDDYMCQCEKWDYYLTWIEANARRTYYQKGYDKLWQWKIYWHHITRNGLDFSHDTSFYYSRTLDFAGLFGHPTAVFATWEKHIEYGQYNHRTIETEVEYGRGIIPRSKRYQNAYSGEECTEAEKNRARVEPNNTLIIWSVGEPERSTPSGGTETTADDYGETPN